MAEARTISRDQVAALIRGFGINNADDALIARAHELNTALMEQLARLPDDVGKDVEPAHVFAVPLR